MLWGSILSGSLIIFWEKKKLHNNSIKTTLICFNPFHVTGPFLYPLKISENRRSDIFRGYKKRPVAWNELKLSIMHQSTANTYALSILHLKHIQALKDVNVVLKRDFSSYLTCQGTNSCSAIRKLQIVFY